MKTLDKIVIVFLCSVLSLAAHAQSTHWSVNAYDYQYDMTAFFTLENNGVAVADLDSYEVAAFVGDECRGMGRVLTQEGNQYGYLRIHSNSGSGETVVFKVYDKASAKEYDVEAYSLTFQSQTVVGMPSSPVVLTILDECTIIVISSDEAKGVVTGGTTVKYGENVTVTATANEGYHFVNWTDGETVVSTDAAYTFSANGDVSLVANFAPNQYTMTFVLDNGQENIVKVQDFNSVLTAPVDPVKEGFTFTGWSPEVPATVPAKDMTFTAQYAVNTYYVIYIVNGEEWARDPVAYGAPIVLREYPVEAGYTFSGWVSDATYETMPAHDVVYTAELATGIADMLADVKFVNVYHLNGTLLYRHISTEQIKEQLPKGVYIVLGKKYVVK